MRAHIYTYFLSKLGDFLTITQKIIPIHPESPWLIHFWWPSATTLKQNKDPPSNPANFHIVSTGNWPESPRKSVFNLLFGSAATKAAPGGSSMEKWVRKYAATT